MDEEILKIFRSNRDDYISGEELSKTLGISRAAIWKHIEKLRDEGYDISAFPHLGYRLVSVPDKLLPFELKWDLKTEVIGKKIYSYQILESTNTIAYRLAVDGAQEGTVISAEGQTKGRGRMGRSWFSPKGVSIYLSIILKPKIYPFEAPKITLAAAVSVAEAINRTTSLSALIKWPNDILIQDKKVCGILTEMDAEVDRINFLILGIGINVNVNKEILPEGATSIIEELGKEFSRLELAKEVLRELDSNYLIFKRDGFAPILKQWQKLSYLSGRRVRVVCQNRKVEGYVVSIDDLGALVLRLDNGFLERILAGDVVMVR